MQRHAIAWARRIPRSPWLTPGHRVLAVTSVVVTNVFGAVTSSVATLTVLVPLGQALDAPGLVWSTSGNAAWAGESTVTHDGLEPAQSGSITDSQTSSCKPRWSGRAPGASGGRSPPSSGSTISPSILMGSCKPPSRGTRDWQQQTFAVANGSHTLKWTYAKDPSVSAGADAGWLDQVTFVPNPPVITLQPLSQHGAMGRAGRSVWRRPGHRCR